eukprot:scaffold21.g2174.t1
MEVAVAAGMCEMGERNVYEEEPGLYMEMYTVPVFEGEVRLARPADVYEVPPGGAGLHDWLSTLVTTGRFGEQNLLSASCWSSCDIELYASDDVY